MLGRWFDDDFIVGEEDFGVSVDMVILWFVLVFVSLVLGLDKFVVC